MASPVRLVVASSNAGKLREYQALAAGHVIELQLFPENDSLPAFEESAPTFAENAAGKALHYSRHAALPVIADDSGLVVPALGGAPGPKSARYAGPGASDAERVKKLLEELRGKSGEERRARFVCVQALAQAGKIIAVFSDFVEGVLLDAPRGGGGFGYDPLFLYEPLGKTFAEIPREEKNKFSHRGGAFRKLMAFIEESR
ncbi:MAG: RdgB/HAM1 family non-canonical purine NTP pyrophosphatase [Acidobacteria bacterium]|nr:RdgB/HAM1 family non-canonical purine NTP pyrophosphatase [Acidobacteriota bacterium]